MVAPITNSKRPTESNNGLLPTEPRSRREESRITKLGIQNPRSESVAAAVTTELEKTKSSREAWKTQREKEIQDDLDAGKGFADMIIDQVWEVWNWGKKKDDESDEK